MEAEEKLTVYEPAWLESDGSARMFLFDNSFLISFFMVLFLSAAKALSAEKLETNRAANANFVIVFMIALSVNYAIFIRPRVRLPIILCLYPY